MEQKLEYPPCRPVDERAYRHLDPDPGFHKTTDGRALAWLSVCSFLKEVDPYWYHTQGTGTIAALTALYRLKDAADAQNKS